MTRRERAANHRQAIVNWMYQIMTEEIRRRPTIREAIESVDLQIHERIDFEPQNKAVIMSAARGFEATLEAAFERYEKENPRG